MSLTKLLLVTFSLALLACERSPDATIVGEWTQPKPGVTNRVTYRADHTYAAGIRDPQRGTFTGAGTWRVEGHWMICRDSSRGESVAEMLKVAQDELEIKGPDGIVSTYERVK